MKRQLIVAGNWKMNKNYAEGLFLAKGVAAGDWPASVQLILATPFIHLHGVGEVISDKSGLSLSAQNCHQETSGAYTGEVSVEMLKSVGAEYVILGHSERRAYFGEDDELLARKVDTALDAGLRPIFCCGEGLDIREAGTHLKYVTGQIEKSLFHLPAESFSKLIIAYEPIWAIGTGRTATPEQAQEMHRQIRDLIADKYGKELADGFTILYGGSCKPGNAPDLFTQPDVDGGLIGGASLKAEDFLAIANSFPEA